MLRLTAALTFGLAAAPTLAQDIIIGEPNWFSGAVMANVLSHVIEARTDLAAEVKPGTNPEIYEAIAAETGEYHVHADAWMPGHGLWVDEAEAAGIMGLSGTTYAGRVGMCAPRYTAEALDIRTVADLDRPEVIEALDVDGDGTIPYWVGADGWQMSAVGQVKMRDYGIADHYEPLITGEGDYQETLYAAFANREHIVFACYEPMSWFAMEFIEYIEEPAYDEARHNLVLPGDSENWLEESSVDVGEPVATVQIVYSTSIAREYPEIAPLLANFGLTNDDITEFMFMVDMKGIDMENAVADWVAANTARVDGWFEGGENL